MTDGGGGGTAAAGEAAGGGGEAMELLSLVRRDKALLEQKAELLSLEVSRLKQAHESLSRQHALTQARLAELTRGGAVEGGGAGGGSHEELMAATRELNLLRDSNTLMRSREAAKEADAKVREISPADLDLLQRSRSHPVSDVVTGGDRGGGGDAGGGGAVAARQGNGGA